MSELIRAQDYCDRIFDGTHESPESTSEGYKLVTSKHISSGVIDFESAYYISTEDYQRINERSKVSQYDILFSMIGTVGTIYMEKNPEVHYAIKNIGVFSCNTKEKAEYLYYFLQSETAKNHIKRYLNGAVQKFLPLNALRDFPVPIFDYTKYLQLRLLSFIDDKISLNNQINAELETMAKTLYDYWFVQFDFPDENGKPYKSSGGKMVYNDQLKREIPEGWGSELLDDIGTIVGGSTPSKFDNDNFISSMNGYPWITPNDLSNNKGNKFISNGAIDVTMKGLKSANLKLYPKGTVLLSSRAPVGYLSIATQEITTNQGFKSFIPDRCYRENYIYYTLQNLLAVIEKNASGSTFKEISATVLKDILVIKPNLLIVREFENRVASINLQILNNEKQNQELTQLRHWLLPMLMNGQVRVE